MSNSTFKRNCRNATTFSEYPHCLDTTCAHVLQFKSSHSIYHKYVIFVTPTKCCVPLFQKLNPYYLIERWSVFQFVNKGGNQVLMVARENAQMVSRFVTQTLTIVCVESH